MDLRAGHGQAHCGHGQRAADRGAALLRLLRCAAQAFVALSLGALAGCAQPLPSLAGREVTGYLTADAVSPLAQASRPPAADPQRSGVVLLRDPAQALAARVLLARSAQRGLDIQVYIWRPDVSGRLLMRELWQAAERGVRVRLLIDDNGSDGMDEWLQALGGHPRIQVRLYNPFGHRRFKALGYLSDFPRLNRRMHNKSFTADSVATVVGGRNVADVYYGVDASTLFADMDALALGPAAQEAAGHFDAYWNSERAYPLAGLLEPADTVTLGRLRQVLAGAAEDQEVAALAAALQRTAWVGAPFEGYPAARWVPVQVLADPPDKPARGTVVAQAPPRITEPILAGLSSARATLELVSPYFVPGEEGVRGLVELARRGVKVRIVTNSLAATDVVAVHAGYARHRLALLAAGVELFELKPHSSSAAGAPAAPWRTPLGLSSSASLHGKVFLADGKRMFIGSFNLDPRSANLNTEMGLVVDSEELVSELATEIQRDLARAAYRLALTADGALRWEEGGAAGATVHATEPEAGLLRRAGAKVLSWLPIDSLL